MKPCTHSDECPECQKLKVTAMRKNELRMAITDRLGVSHLKGTAQLEAAVRRIDQLLLIEEIAAAAEREFVSASQAAVSDAQYDRIASSPVGTNS